MLVSCLCVTEDRPAFVPWLLWNYDKQDHAERELVIVDSSSSPLALPRRPGIRVLTLPRGTSVPAKRNAALDAARGDAITWFDDDDWQHPRKLSLLAAALADGAQLAGCARSWFVELAGGRCRAHGSGGTVLFNGLGARRETAADLRFDERRRRASDTPWLVELRRRAHGATARIEDPLFFWLCHGANLSNRTGRRGADRPLATVRQAIGAAAWGDTDERLVALQGRSRRPARVRRRDVTAGRACVVVTTFERPDGVERLLDDIERERRGDDGLHVRVYDDASAATYDGVRERLAARGWTYRRAAANHGKRGWWRWWNTILAELRDADDGCFFVLQDDMRLCDRFFERAFERWSAIPTDRPAALVLHVDEHRGSPGSSCWTPVRARPAGRVTETGWVDFPAFMCRRDMWEQLGWRLDPVDASWHSRPLLGSGVGAQVSRRLHAAGRRMFLAGESLTVHDESPSLMNPRTRVRTPMRTLRFADGPAAARALTRPGPYRFASLASVPARRRGLEAVVEALAPQVDALGVYLNGYDGPPAWLDDPRVRVVTSAREGDRGDAGKFHWAGRVDGVHVICDDDLHYPADYVEQLVAGIERYERRAVVGFHGAVLHHDVHDYYRSRRLSHFSTVQRHDEPVHVLGTGVCGYHADALRVTPADFPAPNMADVWLAVLGQRQHVPFVCLRRSGGWLREIEGLSADSIYRRAMVGPRGADEPTRAVRAHGPWRLHAATPRVAADRPPRLDLASRRRALAALPPAALAGPAGRVRVAVQGPERSASLWLPAGDHITRAVQQSGTYYESDLLAAMRVRARGGTWVDVGAHWGNHSVFFALECAAERVVAIEPNPAALAGLEANAADHAQSGHAIATLAAAVHPRWRCVRVTPLPWTGRSRTNSGLSTIEPAEHEPSVRAAPLDELLEQETAVAAIKVDVAGPGAPVLATACGVLERDRPIVSVEAANDDAFTDVQRLLAPLGYEPVGRYGWTATWLWCPR